MAEGGGPMKVMPSSVHLFAKWEFSESWGAGFQHRLGSGGARGTYESISRVHSVTTVRLRGADDLLDVEVGGGGAEVVGEGGGANVRGIGVGLGVDGRGADAMGCCCP